MSSESHLFDQHGNRKYLNRIERGAYFRALSRTRNLTERSFCLVLFYTGCRISEGLALTVERVDLRSHTITFETMKRRSRGHFRSVPIPEHLTRLPEKVIADRESKFIWTFSRTTAFRLVKSKMKKAGIAGSMACPKGLRHGFAVACVTENIPLPTVQKWLGHVRMETTAIYLDARGEEEREFAKRIWTTAL